MPCDYSKYPDNWKSEIRPMILESAEHCCEFCGVRNYAIGYRDNQGKFWEEDGSSYIPDHVFDTKKGEPKKAIKIVLTIAHLADPNPMNCHPCNLAALCQRCHNRYDAPMRKRNSRKTREKNMGLLNLFEVQNESLLAEKTKKD